MISSLSRHAEPAELQHLQDLLRRLDPQAQLAVDAQSGEILVQGQFHDSQLADAIIAAGIRSVPVRRKKAEGCCGSCG